MSSLPPVLLDEFAHYVGHPDDILVEALLEMEGVPAATYEVREGQVFVFKKLVELAKRSLPEDVAQWDADAVKALVAQACVSPEDAVLRWAGVPEPFEVLPCAEGFHVYHRAFSARLPTVYPDHDAVSRALVALLCGQFNAEGGDFVHRGQAYVLTEHFDIESLPVRPLFDVPLSDPGHFYSRLRNVRFIEGFAPVSLAQFQTLQALEHSWKEGVARAYGHVSANLGLLWSMLPAEVLSRLAMPGETVPTHGLADAEELRKCYPELGALSDGALYYHYDRYQVECCYLRGWPVFRDEQFLFYLLGALCPVCVEDAPKSGYLVGLALLQGGSLADAISLATHCQQYGTALTRLAARTARVMGFLALAPETTGSRGPAPATFCHLLRRCRGLPAQS